MISNRPRRLESGPYTGYQRYFLTTCTANRHRPFEQAHVTAACILQLRRSAASHDFAIAAYCFVPDHLHVLVYGTSLKANLCAFVIHYKKLTGFKYKQ